MKLATTAFAVSMLGLVACGALAASASVPFAAMTVAGTDPHQDIRQQREAALRTASTASTTYYDASAR